MPHHHEEMARDYLKEHSTDRGQVHVLDPVTKVGDVLDIGHGVKARVTSFDPDTLRGEAQMFVPIVYLLHFDEPYPNGHRPQHYLGHADPGRFDHRLNEHAKGSSKARLTQVMAAAGIGFVVARTWEGDYDLEKSLKRRHKPASLCPICRAKLEEANGTLRQRP